MEFHQYAVQVHLVSLVCFYVPLYLGCIAWECAPENSGIPGSGADGIILGKGILFSKACRAADHPHNPVLWGGKHVSGKRVSFQKL